MSVTPPKPKDELQTAATRLSRAAPEFWKPFMKAFEAYQAEAIDTCINAPANRVLEAQGRVRQLRDLSTLFTDLKQ